MQTSTKLILLVSLLVLSSCMSPSDAAINVAVGSPPAVAGCDSCSGDLSLAVHFEDATNHNVTVGTPCGCSDGDAIYTLASSAVESTTQKSDGTYSLSIPTMADYAVFDVSTNDIFTPVAGTLVFDMYVTTWANYTVLFTARYNATNYLTVTILDDSEIRARYSGAGTVITVETSGASLVVNTWYTITVKWRQADLNPNLSINANTQTTTDNTNLTAWDASATNIWLGDIDVAGWALFIDNVKVYNTWQ